MGFGSSGLAGGFVGVGLVGPCSGGSSKLCFARVSRSSVHFLAQAGGSSSLGISDGGRSIRSVSRVAIEEVCCFLEYCWGVRFGFGPSGFTGGFVLALAWSPCGNGPVLEGSVGLSAGACRCLARRMRMERGMSSFTAYGERPYLRRVY